MAGFTKGQQDLVADIASASFRVAELINESDLQVRLKQTVLAFLVADSLEESYKLEKLIRFGKDIKEIKPINADILLREINRLQSEYNFINSAKDLDLSYEFNNREYLQKLGRDMVWQGLKPTINKPANTRPNNSATNNSANNIENLGRVLEFIVNHKESRFKDIQFSFPNISERTLRRLIDQLIRSNKVERVGNPGPASFYQIPNNGTKSSALIPIKEEPVSNPNSIIAL